MRIARHNGFYKAVGGALLGTTFCLQKLKGKKNILGRERSAVGKARLGIEMEHEMFPCRIDLQRTRNLCVEAERFIAVARHQGLKHVGAEALRSRARLHIERVQAVERARKAQRQRTAFDRVGIGIGQVREVRGQGREAMHGNAMLRAAQG